MSLTKEPHIEKMSLLAVAVVNPAQSIELVYFFAQPPKCGEQCSGNISGWAVLYCIVCLLTARIAQNHCVLEKWQ